MRSLRLLVVAALVLTAGCSGADDPPRTTPSPPVTPSAGPTSTGPQQLTRAEYQAEISAFERDYRSHLDKAAAARTPAQVEAVRRSLVSVLARRSRAWEQQDVLPPAEVSTAHDDIRRVMGNYQSMRTAEVAGKNDCGVAPPAAQQLYDAKISLYRSAEEGAKEAAASASAAGLTFGRSLLPREPVAPKLQNRRPGNGTVVQRSGRRGPSSIRIQNKSDGDTAVLMDGGRKQPRVMVYVRAGKSTTVRGVAGNRSGTFSIKFKQGADWDQRRRGFTRNCSYETFQQFFDTRSDWRISLEKSIAGNAPTTETDPF
ncbi:hypothetical protein AB0M54_12380 [Actinoplanes sp. NPDC051470]|uniref:hypothetical protein n=1 Tax=Actinoplanes sp. NPDC051470 TaxID=3157224 RepID=UPI00344187ED